MIMNRTLHIVSFNIPYPPNYGGVIDVFYKIKALKERGCDIILHCFEYGREQADILNDYCIEVHYYHRSKRLTDVFKSIPFVVSTRNAKSLKENLEKDNYPILFEGLHSTYFLSELAKKGRRLIVRAHNIEHDYYSGLERAESSFLKKIYFKNEARKLKAFESVLRKVSHIAAISPADNDYFEQKYGNSALVPAFHPYDTVSIPEGRGEFALFHGDLSVADNIKSSLFLMSRVFNDLDIPLVIAGKNPDSRLSEKANSMKNVKVIGNPDFVEMEELLANAQVQVLITFQETGIKLKLLSGLYRGRHCIVNHEMVNNTGLEGLCHIGKSAEELKAHVKHLFNISFDSLEGIRRKGILESFFNVRNNADKLIEIIFR